MQQEIYVALHRHGKPVPVGVIVFDPDKRAGAFRYLPSYDGPALDPINLNYRKPFVEGADEGRISERAFVIDTRFNLNLMHRVFVDAMPGHWGMEVLQTEYPELRDMRAAEQCAWLGSRDVGALSLFVRRPLGENPVCGKEALRRAREKSEEFQRTREALGLAGVKNPAFASHGGAMPKAAYRDEAGKEWLAKFNRINDEIDYCALEWAATRTASMLGINTPTMRVIDSGDTSKTILISQRYDRTETKCLHKASMFSLIGEKRAPDLQSGGDYEWIDRIVKEAVDPQDYPAQRDELFRRMLFNVGLNVVDDHLQNHELLLDPDTGKWTLAPAYDMVPFAQQNNHKCSLYGNAKLSLDERDAEKWRVIAGKLGIPVSVAMSELVRIREGIQEIWPDVISRLKINEATRNWAMDAMESGTTIEGPNQFKKAVERAKSAKLGL